MSTRKILFVMNSLTFGGAEKQTIDLINHLNREHFAVGLVYLDKNEDLMSQLDNSNLFVLSCLDRKGKFDFSVPAKLERIVLEHGVDCIFCVAEYTLLYVSLYKMLYKKDKLKTTVALHNTLPRPGVWIWIKKHLHKFFINRTDRVFFVCHNQAHYWQQKKGVRPEMSTVIYNGIDESFFIPDSVSKQKMSVLRASLNFKAGDFIVGICARLSPEKNHTGFLQAVALAKRKGEPVKGLIIGEGPEHKALERQATELLINGDITITGFIQDVRPYLAICDCVVLTSTTETFSISALEAMGMSKALIISKIGGSDEQIKEGVTGFLHDPRDVSSFADSLIRLASDRDKSVKMGKEARKYLLMNFTRDKMVKKYESELSHL